MIWSGSQFMQWPTFEQLSGCCDAHLIDVGSRFRQASVRMTPEAAGALCELAAEAERAGIVLAVASAYRSFERQLAIWNAKAGGQRAVLDAQGRPLALHELTERERVFAILRWSALPGGSRHHWGTDVDVYDAGRLPPGYQLRLTPDEAAPGGVCHVLPRCLDQRLHVDGEASFYRPYRCDDGGVGPEPWHLSYAPQARQIERWLQPGALRDLISAQPLALKGAVLDNFEEIFWRFVLPKGGLAGPSSGGAHVAGHL